MDSINKGLGCDYNASAVIILLVCVGGLLLIGCSSLCSKSLDPFEPGEIKSAIPFIGHAIGILWHQGTYFETLSHSTASPIFTIRILSTRLYIITSPSLIHAAFARPRTLSFAPLMAESTRRLLNFDDATMDIITQSESGPHGRQPYVNEAHDILYATLGPGPSLWQMNKRVLDKEASHLNAIGTKGRQVNLYHWIRNILTEASAAALYGEDNPFADDASLTDSFWDLEADFVTLLIRFFPSLTARKGHQARSRLFAAFRAYFASGKWQHGSGLVRKRVTSGLEHGFTLNQIADCEVLMLFPALSNTVPSAFWLLSHILADGELARNVRLEIAGIVERRCGGSHGGERMNIDIKRLRTSCPLLVAAWDETLRLISTVTSVRTVIADTVLEDSYLLKANSIVLIPGAVTHRSSVIWGGNASVFSPSHFLPSTLSGNAKLTKEDRENKKMQHQAYFPFGGGKHLCPGRHFVFNEILGLIAMILLAFEVERVDGGVFVVSEAKRKKLGEGVVKPDGDIAVIVRRREDFGDVNVGFSVENDAVREGGNDRDP